MPGDAREGDASGRVQLARPPATRRAGPAHHAARATLDEEYTLATPTAAPTPPASDAPNAAEIPPARRVVRP